MPHQGPFAADLIVREPEAPIRDILAFNAISHSSVTDHVTVVYETQVPQFTLTNYEKLAFEAMGLNPIQIQA